MQTQPISNNLEAAAAQALGGQPARPPIPLDSPQAKAARDAFKAANSPPAPEPIGHPNFDEAPENTARRATVAGLRQRLGALARLIRSEDAALIPQLRALQSEAPAVKAAENFDVIDGIRFLNALVGVLEEFINPAAAVPEPVEKFGN